MEKILNIYIPIELHNKMKAQAALQGKSSKQYIIDLIEADLKKEDATTR